MKNILILILICCIHKINGQNADTLYITKNDNAKFELNLKKGDISIFDRELVLKNWNSDIKKLEIIGHWISIKKNKINIDLTISVDKFTQDFFILNFPSVKNNIDTTQQYNKLELGKIIGTLNKKGDIIYDYHFNDKYILTNTDENKIRKAYDHLSKTGKFSKSDCEDWNKAYILFQKISWLTMVNDTFSISEYENLDNLLGPCLGAEYGTALYMYLELFKLIK